MVCDNSMTFKKHVDRAHIVRNIPISLTNSNY